jgi:Zn-dependent protease/CBS domain-containing protein
MRWSWRIATIAGIDVYVHTTFVALILFVLVSEWTRARALSAALPAVLFLLAIFTTVVLHEFGHALTAKRFGIRTRDITLLPIGGIARLERLPDVPRQELWVALAGPAVNVALAILTYAIVVLVNSTPEVPLLPAGATDAGGVFGRFVTINLWLAGFNMIPAFPMDGGRALRAILAERLDYVRATEIAAALGQGLALVFGFVGLFANPFLVFIALFVWMGASEEASSVSIRTALSGIPVSRAMITDFRALKGDDPLRLAADLVLAGSQRDFPVVHADRLVGVLTRDALMTALGRNSLDDPVSDVMTRDFESADAREMLERAFTRLQSCRCPVLPVVSGERLVGLLTLENVGEFVMIKGALRRTK